MPGLTAELYQKYKPIFRTGKPADMSDEYYMALGESITEYENEHLNKVMAPEVAANQQALAAEDEEPELTLSPERVPAELQAPEQPMLSMKPDFSLLPQALSVQPATTRPEGDEAEVHDWQVDPVGASKGKVFVYDVPLDTAKKDLLEHPEKLRALYPDLLAENPLAITPQQILEMEHGSDILEDYQQMTWRDTANAAAGAGKTAIRYAKAPWLQAGAKGGGVLDQLALKLEGGVQPYGEATHAFVMGIDDTSQFGAGRAATEAAELEMDPLNPFGSERVGGITATSAVERNALAESEHPNLHLGGQALGALTGWGASNFLFGQILRGGRAAAGALGGGLASRVATGAVAGTAAAAAQSAGNDLVDVGANAINPEVDAPALEDIPGRAGETALAGAPLAAGGALVGEAALAKAGRPAQRGQPPPAPAPGESSSIRWGNRYDGAVGQLERDLGKDFEVSTVGGPRSKRIEEAKVAARKADQQPGDMMANEIAGPIAKVLDEDVKGVLETVSRNRDEFIRSPEGQEPIPVRNFLTEAVKELRADMQAAGKQKVPKAVGKKDSGGELVDFVNTQIDHVSLEPVEGAIALSPEEAQAFLGRDRHKELLRAQPVKAPPGGPRQPFAPADRGTLEAHRTVNVRGEPPGPPPLVEKPAIPGPGRFQAPEGVLGEPLPTRGPSPGPAEPALIEPPVPSRPSTSINASEPRQSPERPAATPSAAGAMSEGKAPEAAPAPGRAAASRGTPREKLPRGKNLSDTLRKRGVETVYIVPRAYDAEHTETLLDKIAAEQKKGNRDLTKLDKAARVDRDARKLGGKAGGWSQLQNQHSELIEKSKRAEELGAPGGSAFKVLTGYGKEKPGELLRTDVLRDAADRAGVREHLDRIRSLERYDQLRGQTHLERASGDTRTGAFTRAAELSSVRLLPMLDTLSGLGGGLGRASNLRRDADAEARKKKKLEEKR
jgi:hypothetical protein